MPFDPQEFGAKVVLGELHPEDMPSAAQDALEAGFDGPAIVRLAILDDPSAWETDQLIPKVFAELGVERPGEAQAAILLAKIRGRRILDTGEDPLGSLGYFHHIFVQAGYPDELSELGWFDEPYVSYNVEGSAAEEEQARVAAIEAVENLFDSDLRAKRHEERKVRSEEDRRRIVLEWPWKLNSPTGRSEYWRRWREHWFELRWPACIYCGLAVLLGWLGDRWTILLTWLLIIVPFTVTLYSIVLWRRMSYEVQALRWRQRVDL